MAAQDTNPTRDTDFAATASDSYARLRELFAAASELAGDERARWISANVPDAGERVALERLLSFDLYEDGYFEIPLDEHAARMAVEEPMRADGLIGEHIGAFRLTQLLGQGGMAAVFLGEREGDFQQRVAIKLLRRGLYSEIEQRLFRRERQLLAGLDHPNIARLIDGGVTAAGIPYLIIEYVDGIAITRHAAVHRLDVGARLELFLVVCRAVEAAHRALIVHRDIKPANILVASDGTVKLLDFGIAKLLEDDGENATVGVFTPEYAAPEQIANAAVTTATDVFALGVLLHELLLGERPQRHPLRRPSQSVGAAAKHISVSKPALLERTLRGDLDTIVLKCLAEEPEQRYASAGALADDVQRYLSGRPVEAHPPSRCYRARKFLRRHRASAMVTAVLAISILAALAIALWQANIARYEAARAGRVRDFMEGMFAPIENSVIEARQTSVHDLLANATEKLHRNSELTVAERIDLQLLFSRLHEKMGEPDEAQALAQQAAQLAETKLSAGDPEALAAEISYAYALLEHDDQARAEPMLKSLEARVSGRPILQGVPLVVLYDGLAEIADMHGNHEIALGHERRALQERLVQSGPDSASAATGYNNVAISLDLSGHHVEAIEAFRHSYAIHLKEEGPDSLETANARNNLAMAELQAGRLRAAREDFVAVEPLYEAAPNNRRNRYARYWQDRCQLVIAIGGAETKPTCDRAMQVTKQILGPGEVAWTARALRLDAQAKLDLGDLEGSRRDLEQANALITPGGDPVALGIDDYLLAELDFAQGDSAAAAQGFAHSVERIGHAFPEYLRLRVLATQALACASATGLSVTVCPLNAAAVARKELDAYGNPWNPWLLPAHIAIARIDLDSGHPQAAIVRLRSAIEHAGPEVDAAQIHLLAARIWLVIAEAGANHCDQAIADWRAAVETIRANNLEHHFLLSIPLTALRATPTCTTAFAG